MAFPVASLPVNVTCDILGCSTIHCPSSLPPETIFITPGGNTSFAISPIIIVVKGVYGEGLMTTVFPVMTDGNILLAAIAIGKFHGVIAPTTPRGT